MKFRVRKHYVLAGLVCLLALVAIPVMALLNVNPLKWMDHNEAQPDSEGKLRVCEIIAGPFDIHRKYRSMEGPFVNLDVTPGELVSSGKIVLPEGMVNFIEKGSARPSMAATMQPAGGDQSNKMMPVGLVSGPRERKLYWLKGVTLHVLDEQNKPLPSAEFICHWNLDCKPAMRNKVFTTGRPCVNPRLIGISQGLTSHMFPEGVAVPVASDEPWHVSFQAANRTTDQHRRLKHVARFFFIADEDLYKPITALQWYAPYIAVVTEGNSPELAAKEVANAPHCLATSAGLDAPNSMGLSMYKDPAGRQLTGHWVVPPGTHTYKCPISEVRDADFGKTDRRLHAAWTHVHPVCTKLALVNCTTGKAVYEAHIQTRKQGGLEIKHIDWLSNKQGILVPAGKYRLEETYVNDTGSTLDSMGSMGLYFADYDFRRPDWTAHKRVDTELGACSIPSCERKPVTQQRNLSAFDLAKDGPLLTKKKTMELNTSCGALHVVLDPAYAPIHATQIYKLLSSHAYDGTTFYQYNPGFNFQVPLCEDKAKGQKPLPPQVAATVRSLPLEVASQERGSLKHQRLMLSMCRDEPKDSARTSFSILLADAPQLDREYTIFGYLADDQTTSATLARMTKTWSSAKRPWIVSSKEI